MICRRKSGPLVAALVGALLLGGCSSSLYHQGISESKKGNWDMAVARLTKAVDAKPDNIPYRIALENAKVKASQMHYELAKKHVAASELDRALEELQIASNFDPSNKSIADDLTILRQRVKEAAEQKDMLSGYDAIKNRADQAPANVPVLSPRSTVPITLRFNDVGLEKIFQTLSRLSGVNILVDQDYRDKKVSIDMANVTFEDALDQLTFVNRLFYAVLDENTLIVVPDTPAKRRTYEQVLLRTFYIQNADLKDIEQVLKTTLGTHPKIASNASLNAITILGTLDELALARRLVDLNDKSRGEVVLEVQVLEISKLRARTYGIQLANAQAGLTFSPLGGTPTTPGGGATSIRAFLLSSLNAADFIVTIPRSLLLSFIENPSNGRILAAPRLRAAEGKKATLQIGTETPVPVTTFQATQTGGGTFTPATSFQYRNVGVNMDITPRVNPNGDIILEMAAEFSIIGPPQNLAGQELPTFLTRKVNGIVRLRDGETSLLGGLLASSRTESASGGVLGLASIPILNKIFPQTTSQLEDREVLISITPHLVRAPKILESDLRAMPIGTMEVYKVPGARPPLFGPDTTPTPAPSPSPTSLTAPRTGVAAPGTPAVATPGPGPAGMPTTSLSPPPGARPAGSPPDVQGSVAPPIPGGERINPTVPIPPVGGQMEAPANPTPAPTAGGGAAVSLSPASVNVPLGQTATVSVVAMEASNLSQIEVVLSYDPAVLQGVDALPGPLLTLDGASVASEKQNETGRLRVQFTRPTGVSGSGVVATVTFRGLRPGSAVVTPELLRLSTTPGGDVTVPAAPVRVEVGP